MTTKIKNRNLIIGVLIGIVAIFLLGGWLGRARADRLNKPIINDLNKKISQYEYRLDSVVKYATEIEQLVAEQKEIIEAGVIERSELRKLNIKRLSEVTALKARVKILIDSVKHNGQVVHIIDTVSNDPFTSVIYLPFEYKEQNKYYTLWGGFDVNGNMSHNIDMPVSLGVFTGWDKDKKVYKAVVTSDNPHFTVSDISSVKVEPRKTIIDKAWFRLLSLGTAFGIGVMVGN